MTGRLPEPGDILHLTTAASVQFAQAILFRVIRPHDWSTYVGWIWLDGYELNATGDAVVRRSVFVQLDGLKYLDRSRIYSTHPSRNARPALPKQRRPTTPSATRHQHREELAS